MIVIGNEIYSHSHIGGTFLSIPSGYMGIETYPPISRGIITIIKNDIDLMKERKSLIGSLRLGLLVYKETNLLH